MEVSEKENEKRKKERKKEGRKFNCTQLNAFKHCYPTLIVLFAHSFPV